VLCGKKILRHAAPTVGHKAVSLVSGRIPSIPFRRGAFQKWARLDSNQGPTDYEIAAGVSGRLGRSGETALLRDFSNIRLARISVGLGGSCSHPVLTPVAYLSES
jgi:hypothetical protein